MSTDTPVAFGVAGLGGFGASVRDALQQLQAKPSPLVKFVAACEPAQELHAATIAKLKSEGVTVVDDFQKMLALPIQAVWLPVPIHLHRPFTEKALAAGKWVISEKPASGTIQDIDAMIAARDRHQGKVAIAFQDIHERSTGKIKQRILDGALGRITYISVSQCAPRPKSYYDRNNWGGRLRIGETWILDSPCTNAMAHSVNLALFLAGPELNKSAVPQSVDAELYRSRDIPSADTTCIRAHLPGGSKLLILMTHACATVTGPFVVLRGEKGELHMGRESAEFRYTDGRTETIARTIETLRTAEVAIERWTGRNTSAPLAELEVARQQTLTVNGAFDATPIRTLSKQFVQMKDEAKDPQPYVPDIESVFAECVRRGVLPHESGLAPWSSPAGSLNLQDYKAFAGRHC